MHLDVALLPRRLFKRLPLGHGAAHHVNVLLSVALITLIFLSERAFRFVESLPHWCLVEGLLGVPCPGCNISGSLSLIAHGAFASSLRLHPCGVLLVGVVAVQSAARVAVLLRLAPECSANGLIKTLGESFILALLLCWLFRLVGN